MTIASLAITVKGHVALNKKQNKGNVSDICCFLYLKVVRRYIIFDLF